MKSFSLRLLVCFFGFALGSGAVVAWLFYQTSRVGEVAPPASFASSAECVKPRKFPALARKISEIEKGKSGYFPKDVFSSGKWAARDDFVNDWYGRQLIGMNETSLLDAVSPGGADGEREIYRFLWLRSFHHPVFVRVERSGNQIELYTKELNGAGGYGPGEVLRGGSRELDRSEWCEFLELLRQANYWNLPTEDLSETGLDGAQWILEGVRNNRYHVVDRWSPETGEFRAACLYLLRLSGFEIDKRENDLY